MNTAFNLEQFLKQATPVEDKYTRTPNYLVDKGYVSEMTGSALKCYVVINRFTDGFCRSNWSITSSFLQEKTGIKKLKTLTDSVRQLEQLGLVLVVRSTGETNKFSIIHPEFEPPAKMDGSAENGMDTTPKMVWGVPTKMEETTPKMVLLRKKQIRKKILRKIYVKFSSSGKWYLTRTRKHYFLTNVLEKSKLVLLTVTRLKTSNWQSQIVLSLITMFRADILTSN